MNRRGFLQACFAIPAAAAAAKLVPWAPALDPAPNFLLEQLERAMAAMAAQRFDCASMSYILVHPAQFAKLKREAGQKFTGRFIAANPACPPDKAYAFQDVGPGSAGYWRAACPT